MFECHLFVCFFVVHLLLFFIKQLMFKKKIEVLGMFEILCLEAWQVQERIFSIQMQVPNGTGPGDRMIKRQSICFTIQFAVFLHKRPYKSRFISNSSHCSTTILSKHITSALTAVKDHVIKYSETAFSNSNVNYFWSIKNSSEIIEKLRLRNFRGPQVSSFDFSTLYISLPHDLIKAKVLSLVNWCFNRESKT